MNSERAAVRNRMRALRRALSAEESAFAAACIGRQLRARQLTGPVAVYLATAEEISLDAFIEDLLAQGVQVVAPRWNGTAYELARLTDWAAVRAGPMQVREPLPDAETLPPEAVATWLVPGLAFTPAGHRLGYGGGWYDRLLAGVTGHKIGIAHPFQLCEDFPAEAQDVAVDEVMTTLDTTALAIARLIARAGGRAYVVGGAVRDRLLHRTSKDLDLEVFGLSAAQLQEVLGTRFAFDACGLSFGVLKIKHHEIDIALPRRESKRGQGHKGFLIDSDPTLTLAEAAGRRDFTVNAIYYDPLTGQYEDPYGGIPDLHNRILRHVSPKFAEDPLRVLRGMQFVARFDLTPAPETLALCRKIEIEGLPPERLFEEWAKFLTKGVAMQAGMEFLRATGWVRYFPELNALINCRQDPAWHPEGDVWNHTCLCLEAFARHRTGEAAEDLIVGLAVLCHDFGKPATTRYDPVKKRIRSLGHDEAGVVPTLSFLRRLTHEERLLREVPPLVQCHMRPYAMWKGQVGDSAVRKLALKVGRIDRLLRVAQADDEGRGEEVRGGSSAGEDLKWLAAQAERLRVAAEAPKPILLGRHLIALGYTPSPQFGRWLKACFDAQLEGAFADVAGAITYFKQRFPRPR